MSIVNRFNPQKSPDFNGDGKTDVFWFNRDTRQTEFWLLDGVSLKQQSASVTIGTSGWQDPVAADFDGDGKSDLFWRNSQTGDNVFWLMDGTTIREMKFIPQIDRLWQAQIGDFNGDRKADLLWHNDRTGENQIWLMNGIERTQQATLPTLLDWQPQIADFSADGKSDLFFRNRNTGENQVWTIDGGTLLRQETVRSQAPAWSYELADYNGDGRSDAIWRDSVTGRLVVWEWSADGITPSATDLELPAKGRDFQYFFTDFNNDRRSDIIVRNPSTGESQLWINEGQTLRYFDLFGLPGDWQPIPVDLDGNSQGDLVWRNNTGAVLTWRLENQRVVELNVLPMKSLAEQWVPVW
jgi:hypothetical protein